jgi:hypothetical protein
MISNLSGFRANHRQSGSCTIFGKGRVGDNSPRARDFLTLSWTSTLRSMRFLMNVCR